MSPYFVSCVTLYPLTSVLDPWLFLLRLLFSPTVLPILCRLHPIPCICYVKPVLLPPPLINLGPWSLHWSLAEFHNQSRHNILSYCVLPLEYVDPDLLETHLHHLCLQQWIFRAPSYHRLRRFPVIIRANLCWKLPRAHPMQGFSIHVSDPKINTTCTTALENIPDTIWLTPYLPSILVIRAQLFRDFLKFPTTFSHSSPPPVKIPPSI